MQCLHPGLDAVGAGSVTARTTSLTQYAHACTQNDGPCQLDRLLADGFAKQSVRGGRQRPLLNMSHLELGRAITSANGLR